MKRQRNNVNCSSNKGTKKQGGKSKKCLKVVEHQKVVKEEETETGGGGEVNDAALKEGFVGWEDWPWLGTREVVDEQMSWGSIWMPFWDVEAYSRMYGNLVWDDDIWNLKTLTTIPNP